jgi:3-oxoacyl-[acyl-carrier-protein] synthase-3
MIWSKLIGCGAFLPEKVLTNDDLSHLVDTTDEWITTRTGIKKRHIAGENETTSDLAVAALQDAFASFDIDKNTIDGIIVATTTPDIIFPSTAALIQKKIGVTNGFAFDLNAVCAGFVYALVMADSLVKSGAAKRIAVIGAETMSRIVDWKDRSTCVLFGDGAGAFIIEASKDANKGIVAANIAADGRFSDILLVNGGVSKGNCNAKIFMNGKEVYKHAVEKMSATISSLLSNNGLSVENLDWIIPHQANIRIMDAMAERLGVNRDKMVATVDKHANTSAATIPLAFCDYYKRGLIKDNHLIAMTAVGAGVTYGGAIMKV